MNVPMALVVLDATPLMIMKNMLGQPLGRFIRNVIDSVGVSNGNRTTPRQQQQQQLD
jgi:hypothetical protein